MFSANRAPLSRSLIASLSSTLKALKIPVRARQNQRNSSEPRRSNGASEFKASASMTTVFFLFSTNSRANFGASSDEDIPLPMATASIFPSMNQNLVRTLRAQWRRERFATLLVITSGRHTRGNRVVNRLRGDSRQPDAETIAAFPDRIAAPRNFSRRRRRARDRVCFCKKPT
jgi:hypothetical protein